MNKLTKWSLLAGFLAFATGLFAQSPSTQTDYLESTGKIYVVVVVIAVIFIGILLLLINLERRLARMEKANKEREV